MSQIKFRRGQWESNDGQWRWTTGRGWQPVSPHGATSRKPSEKPPGTGGAPAWLRSPWLIGAAILAALLLAIYLGSGFGR